MKRLRPNSNRHSQNKLITNYKNMQFIDSREGKYFRYLFVNLQKKYPLHHFLLSWYFTYFNFSFVYKPRGDINRLVVAPCTTSFLSCFPILVFSHSAWFQCACKESPFFLLVYDPLPILFSSIPGFSLPV